MRTEQPTKFQKNPHTQTLVALINSLSNSDSVHFEKLVVIANWLSINTTEKFAKKLKTVLIEK